MTADHPVYAPQIGSRFESTQYACDTDNPDDCTCPEEGCLKRQRLCIVEDTGESCYERSWLCPQIDADKALCKDHLQEGDPDVARAPWVSVQGVSQNYLLLYAKDAIPAQSHLAAELGADDDLPAGYHLLHVRLKTERELADAHACQRRAEHRAAEDYNRDQDANYDVTQLKTSPCLVPGFCTRDVFAQYVARAVFERGCPINDRVMTPASTHPTTPITVELEREFWSPLAPSK